MAWSVTVIINNKMTSDAILGAMKLAAFVSAFFNLTTGAPVAICSHWKATIRSTPPVTWLLSVTAVLSLTVRSDVVTTTGSVLPLPLQAVMVQATDTARRIWRMA